jgi:hypothetical protein
MNMRRLPGGYWYKQAKLVKHGDDPKRPYRELQTAAKALWPGDKTFITCEDFSNIIEKAPADFVEKFGSDYQKDIKKEHLKQLFWLVIPTVGEVMHVDSFVRAIVALYQPKPYTPLPIYTNELQDPKHAAPCIEFLYAMLKDKDLCYVGDSRRKSDQELSEKKEGELKTSCIVRLTDPDCDGPNARGINITITHGTEKSYGCLYLRSDVIRGNTLFFWLDSLGYPASITDPDAIGKLIKDSLETMRINKEKDKEAKETKEKCNQILQDFDAHRSFIRLG